jgi:hypothetical protein
VLTRVVSQCGEESPSCSNCIDRHVTCAYHHLRVSSERLAWQAHSSDETRDTDHLDDRRQAKGPASDSRSGRSYEHRSEPESPRGISRLQELHLVIHYTTNTCETLAHGPEDIDVWRKVVPSQALQHDFLMNGILALSALHFACEKVEMAQHYYQTAMHYQNTGLQQFKKALGNISAENEGALFAYSIITNILALAYPNVCAEPDHSHVETIIALPKLLRGVGLLTKVATNSFSEGDYAALFRFPASTESPSRVSHETDAIAKLRERIGHIAKSTDPVQCEAYMSGIASLEQAFYVMQDSKHLGIVMAWPTTISEQLLELFKQGDPMAQFIFLHYGVLLLHARDRWWGRNTGAKLVDTLATSLHNNNPEWMLWTKWARETAINGIKEQPGS